MLNIEELKSLSSIQLIELKKDTENKIKSKKSNAASFYKKKITPFDREITIKYDKINELEKKINNEISIYNSENFSWHLKYNNFYDYAKKATIFILFSYYIWGFFIA